MTRSFALVLVVAGFALGAAFTHAKEAGPLAKVVEAASLCTKTAKHGKAWITPLVVGPSAFVGRLEMAAGAQVPEHKDATDEYIHVLAGGGRITIDGKVSELGAGDTVYMPANAVVSFQNGAQHMTALQVFAGPAPASKYDAWEGCK